MIRTCIDCKKPLSGKFAKRCQSCAKKGKLHPNYGKRFGEVHKKHFCKDCRKRICLRTIYGGHRCSSCNAKLRIGSKNSNFGNHKLAGKNHPNWQGGITSLLQQIRHCFKYRQWRSDVFTRDDFTCQVCGKRGGNLEVDHYPVKFSDIFRRNKIKSLAEALRCEEFWNINNGRTLCEKCHNKTKRK